MSERIYFGPIQSQPYHVKKAAEWLIRLGKIKNYSELVDLEKNNPAMFKYLMSEYHRVHSFKTGYLVQTNDIGAFRSAVGPYGDEPHMYFSKTRFQLV